MPKKFKITISSDLIKLIYSEKATKIWHNLSQGLDVATYKSNVQTSRKMAPNFCGLLRKPELQHRRKNISPFFKDLCSRSKAGKMLASISPGLRYCMTAQKPKKPKNYHLTAQKLSFNNISRWVTVFFSVFLLVMIKISKTSLLWSVPILENRVCHGNW